MTIDRPTALQHLAEARDRMVAARRIGDRRGLLEAHQQFVRARREVDEAADAHPDPVVHEARSTPKPHPAWPERPGAGEAAIERAILRGLRSLARSNKRATMGAVLDLLRRGGVKESHAKAAIHRLLRDGRLVRITRRKLDYGMAIHIVELKIRR